MAQKKFLIVGGGGREASFAANLARDGSGTSVYAVMPHENPLIARCVGETGGSYLLGDPGDPDAVSEFASLHAVDYAFVNADEPLANGVTDALLARGLRAVGGTKAAARIEWDKVYAMGLMGRICPEYTPYYRVVSDARLVGEAVSDFESRGVQLVVKPQGLTGGKGVKVMPEHLATYDACAEYTEQLLESHPEESVLLVERLDGIEFTIMGLTDGRNLVMAPATYDYPYRFEGDSGPGTGGMGCFADSGAKLPFMSDSDLADCRTIMHRIITHMDSENLGFTGVLNGGFFKTSNGIKFMEFNSRFGDPECLNVLSVLSTPLSEVISRMWDGTVSDQAISFARRATVNKYLVAKEYPSASPEAVDFEVDDDKMEEIGVTVYYASCVGADDHDYSGGDNDDGKTGGRYRTIKKSRAVAFSATRDTIPAASDAVNAAIESHFRGDLEYRGDIGSAKSLARLVERAERLGM